MTKGLLGNFVALNTALRFPLSHEPSVEGVTSTSGYHTTPVNPMSTLISGSVADTGPLEYTRTAPGRVEFPYDPFTYRPHARDTPRTEHPESPFVRSYARSRTLPSYDAGPSQPLQYITSATFPGADMFSYLPRDESQRVAIVEDRPSRRRLSQDSFSQRTNSPPTQDYAEFEVEGHRRSIETGRNVARYHPRRQPFKQDEFDDPVQYLALPLLHQDSARAQELPELPVHLEVVEQDDIMRRANNILSECAFHFIAKYQFPVPLERNKPRIVASTSREWTEWAYLLKRLATKRRIPARVLYDNQIKQLVTTLENSVAAHYSTNKGQISPKRHGKDDRYILQLISAGTQVARILMDSLAMKQLSDLYTWTEAVISDRRDIAQANSGLR